MTKREITPPTPSCHLYASPLPCSVIFEGFTAKENEPQRAKNNHIFSKPMATPFSGHFVCFNSPRKCHFVIFSFPPTPPMSFVYLPIDTGLGIGHI